MQSERNDEQKYPRLKKHKKYDFIVLFTAGDTGPVVFSNDPMWKVGEGNDDQWAEEGFVPYEGTVVLSN